jgi:hypothetical protein
MQEVTAKRPIPDLFTTKRRQPISVGTDRVLAVLHTFPPSLSRLSSLTSSPRHTWCPSMAINRTEFRHREYYCRLGRDAGVCRPFGTACLHFYYIRLFCHENGGRTFRNVSKRVAGYIPEDTVMRTNRSVPLCRNCEGF